MEKYAIENRNGDDYITSIDNHFTLKVIPPKKQDEDKEYTPYKVVGAVFEIDEDDVPTWMLNANAEIPTDWSWGECEAYDFEGMDIAYADDDVPNSNKKMWLDAINYYCQLKLAKPVVGLLPYNYNYEFSELNCDEATLRHLNGEITFEEYEELTKDRNS